MRKYVDTSSFSGFLLGVFPYDLMDLTMEEIVLYVLDNTDEELHTIIEEIVGWHAAPRWYEFYPSAVESFIDEMAREAKDSIDIEYYDI